jgi:hypothetical protein
MARFPLRKNFYAQSLVKRTLPLFVLSLAFLIPFGVKTAFAGKVEQSDLVVTFFSPYQSSRKAIGKYTKMMKEINARNAAVEDSQEWIAESYKSFKIRKLNNVPRQEYERYKKYAGTKRRIYIIVHPAYYTFFGEGNLLEHPLAKDIEKLKVDALSGEDFPQKNLVERLYDKMAFEETFFVMQEQERMLRDFVEVYSTQSSLMLLVLPRNHKQHPLYVSKDGYDEFTRYINEITNESDSVLYMESASHNSGGLTFGDLEMLMTFLDDLDIRTIALGGGYVGRCLDGFYETMLDAFGYDHIYMVPEIVAVSPLDIKGSWGRNLITSSGKLNLVQLHRNLKNPEAYDKKRTVPKLKHFYMYRFLKAKLARTEGASMNDEDNEEEDTTPNDD